MTTDLSFAFVALVLLIGFLATTKLLLNIAAQLKFARSFLHKYRQYYTGLGRDESIYTWLLERSVEMQGQMGEYGLATFHPAGSYQHVVNYPMIVAGLPKLRLALRGAYSIHSAMQDAHDIEDYLVRYVGQLKRERRRALRNFFILPIWFPAGIRVLLSTPVWFLQWIGLLSEERASNINKSPVFVTVQALATAITFLSAVVGLIASVEPAAAIVQRLFNPQ